MDEYAIVLMQRDKATGFLEKELGSYKLDAYENLMVNIYAEESGDGYLCFMKISTDKTLDDWEFEAIYDYYDGDVFQDETLSFTEVGECFNPTWEISFPYDRDADIMTAKIIKLLKIHDEELRSVYEEIKDKQDEYPQI